MCSTLSVTSLRITNCSTVGVTTVWLSTVPLTASQVCLVNCSTDNVTTVCQLFHWQCHNSLSTVPLTMSQDCLLNCSTDSVTTVCLVNCSTDSVTTVWLSTVPLTVSQQSALSTVPLTMSQQSALSTVPLTVSQQSDCQLFHWRRHKSALSTVQLTVSQQSVNCSTDGVTTICLVNCSNDGVTTVWLSTVPLTASQQSVLSAVPKADRRQLFPQARWQVMHPLFQRRLKPSTHSTPTKPPGHWELWKKDRRQEKERQEELQRQTNKLTSPRRCGSVVCASTPHLPPVVKDVRVSRVQLLCSGEAVHGFLVQVFLDQQASLLDQGVGCHLPRTTERASTGQHHYNALCSAKQTRHCEGMVSTLGVRAGSIRFESWFQHRPPIHRHFSSLAIPTSPLLVGAHTHTHTQITHLLCAHTHTHILTPGLMPSSFNSCSRSLRPFWPWPLRI